MPHTLNVFVTLLVLALCTTSSSSIAKQCRFGLDYQGPKLAEPLDARQIRAAKIQSSNHVSAELALALQHSFNQAIGLTEATSASASVYSPNYGYWSHQFSDQSNTSQTGNANDSALNSQSFWLASISKLAIATVIAQLIEEKQLLPEDSIERWLPNIPHAQLITIDQLLTHTSGLRDFKKIDGFVDNHAYHAPAELLQLAINQSPDFCPGTDWNYSNTGYLVLAMIAEQLDQQPLHRIIERRIARPLALSSFRVARKQDVDGSVVQPAIANDKRFITSIVEAHGAASIISNTDDALLFLSAYLRGDLISDSSVNDSLQTLYPLHSEFMAHGRGIMVTRAHDSQHTTTWVGHTGGSTQGQALLLYDLSSETYMAITLNTRAPIEVIARQLLSILANFQTEI